MSIRAYVRWYFACGWVEFGVIWKRKEYVQPAAPQLAHWDRTMWGDQVRRNVNHWDETKGDITGKLFNFSFKCQFYSALCSLTLGWASWQFKRICILNFKCSVNSPNRPKFLKKYFLNSSILRNENKYMGHLIAVITAATAHKYNYSSRVCSWVFMKVEALFWKTPMS